MSRRTRRTLPGTLAPGDAYAPSLFGDDPAVAGASRPAPLALFSPDVGAALAAAPIAPPAPCAVCGDADHLTAACYRGAAVALFDLAPDSRTQPAPEAAEDAELAALEQIRRDTLVELAETGASPFQRRKAAEALAALDIGDEAAAARAIDILTANP